MGRYDGIIDRLLAYSNDSDAVSAVVIVGSQARDTVAADEYSDLDVIMVVDDPSFFITSDDWLNGLGPFHIAFTETTIGGDTERRVLFDGGLDVDFVIISRRHAEAVLASADGLLIYEKGCRVLIDKAGLTQSLPRHIAPRGTPEVPTETAFSNLVNDFWYHTVWCAKKLLRGELWTAKSCLDVYLKGKLLSIIELHARLCGGEARDTWYRGRFIETWADRRIIEGLKDAFAHYDKEDMKRALLKTMDLCRWVALEVSEKAGCTYPHEAEASARLWMSGHL